MKKRLFVVLLCVLLCASAGVTLFLVFGTHAQQSSLQAAGNDDDQEPLRSAPLSSTGSCGVERWSVKTGTDAVAGLINLQSTTQTTIAALAALPAPANLPSNNRVQPTETTVFQL